MGGLFGIPSGGGSTGFDFSVLSGYYLAKSLPKSAAASTPRAKSEPASVQFAPWSQKTAPQTNAARLRDALGTTSFVDVRESDINKASVASDHKKLFAVYKGLSRLQALATRAAEENAQPGERRALNRRFQAGLAEIKSFLADQGFDDLSMLFGDKVSKVDSGYRKVRPPSIYTAPFIVSGAASDAIAGLTGTETFTVTLTKSSGTINVAMDLSEITGTLSIDNLISYMNQKLEAAGVYSRFSKNTQNGAKDTDPKRIGLAVQTVATERVSFSATATQPALYVGGVAGPANSQSGQLIKLTDDGGSAVTNFSKKISATNGISDVRGTATDAEGNVYAVGSATGDVEGAIVQGEQDVYLRKYDAAGHLIWSRLLGSAKSASGYAVATDSSGNVAIAGKVSDRLSSTATGGGEDSFVAKYDSLGREVFLRQISPLSNDAANALAFTSDGDLLVAGQTESAMSSSLTHGGSSDAFLMRLSGTGSLEWVRQFGGSGDDRATALSLDADGNAILGSVESGVATVRKLGVSDGTTAAVWELQLGTLGQGNLSAVAVDGSDIYVAGSTSNASLDAGGQATIVTAHSGANDGFVTKLTDSGVSAAAVFTSYVGTASSDSVVGIAVGSGSLYVAGSTSGNLSGTSSSESADAFVQKLGTDGTVVWTQQFENAAGASAARSLTLDVNGASVLDKLGLPRGTIAFDDTRLLTAGSSVRAGDHFFLRVNDGLKIKVSVDAGETMRSLVRKVSNVLLLKGTAEISRTGGDGIKISAKEGAMIELLPGASGYDALEGLGIEPVKLDARQKSATSNAKTFALGLSLEAMIEDKLKANTLTYQVGSAMEVIKSAYMSITGTTLRSGGAIDQRALNSYRTALGALGK